ncbi:YgfZ/GcvT domain-containing protein, partial [Bacteroidota bacterium]
HGASMRDLSGSNVLLLRGKDVLDYLHRVSTNSIKDLDKFEYVNTLFTNEKGRIIDRTTLLQLDGFFILIGNSAVKEKLIRWLDRYIITEDIIIKDTYSSYSLFEILGPQAESYMTLICGKCIDLLNTKKIIQTQIEDSSVYIYKKEEGAKELSKYRILFNSINYEKVLSYFLERKSVFNFSIIGKKAYETYRIEKGIPISPNEINDSFNPHESNLLNDISFTKGCYIGQEVIARLDTYDEVQKKLTKVNIDKYISINDQQVIVYDQEDNEAGVLTSIAEVNNGEVIGLAYIRKNYLENGTKLKAENNGYKIEITVTNHSSSK